MSRPRPVHNLDRVTVAEAAERLDMSQDAVRKRIACGTIEHDKDPDGRVFVYLSPSETKTKTDQDEDQDKASKTVWEAHVKSLEEQIDYLRSQLEEANLRDQENRRIIAILTQHIPQLEPRPQEPLGGSESASEGSGRVWM